jgi:biopolymer transport protein ExbB
MEHGIMNIFIRGGFVMFPLLVCSIVTWVVIFERLWRYRKLGQEIHSFQLEALNTVLRSDYEALKRLCGANPRVPTSVLMTTALERLGAKDGRLRQNWREAVERRRLLTNQELKRGLWILGTIGSASPFIGLLGTVVGILRSFGDMAKTGAGGFNVVAAGISEALVATAVGLVVALIALMAYNAFQSRWAALILAIKLNTEEFTEILGDGTTAHGG